MGYCTERFPKFKGDVGQVQLKGCCQGQGLSGHWFPWHFNSFQGRKAMGEMNARLLQTSQVLSGPFR